MHGGAPAAGLVAAARQPADAGRHAVAARAGRAGLDRARRQRHGDHRCRQRSRRDARARLRARAGTLLRDGPAASHGRRRTRRAVRPDRGRHRQAPPPASHARAGGGPPAAHRRRPARGARGIRGRRECRDRGIARAAVALPAAAAIACALARRGQPAGRRGDVLRPAGCRQRARTRAVADPPAPAGCGLCATGARRHALGRAAAGRATRRCGAAGCEPARPAAAARADRSRARGRGDQGHAREQQFRGLRRADRRRPRDRRQRHAPRPARTQPVVPRPPALPRSRRARGPRRRAGRDPARPAGRDRRQQRACRLGLHQQLRRLPRLEARTAVRIGRQHGLRARGEAPRAHRGRRWRPGRLRRGRDRLGAGRASRGRRPAAGVALDRAPGGWRQPRPAADGACTRCRRRAADRRRRAHPDPEPGAGGSRRRDRLAPARPAATTRRRLQRECVGRHRRLHAMAGGQRRPSGDRLARQRPPVDGERARGRWRGAATGRRWRLRVRCPRPADPRCPVHPPAFRRT